MRWHLALFQINLYSVVKGLGGLKIQQQTPFGFSIAGVKIPMTHS